MKLKQQNINNDPRLIEQFKRQNQEAVKKRNEEKRIPKKKNFGMGLLKLQKAVRSRKFDLIKHVLKQFARIREASQNGPDEQTQGPLRGKK